MPAAASGPSPVLAAARRRVVVVLGMPRSGTSLLTSLLHEMGIEAGENLVAADANNEEGYWEHTGIYETQEQLLRSLGRRWIDPTGTLPFPPGWWQTPGVAPFKSHLAKLVCEEVSKRNGLWVFKDPRTPRLLPMWREIFAELDFDPVYLLSIRRPDSVVESMARLYDLPVTHTELLWLLHNLDAVRDAGDQLRLVVDYDLWFTRPADQARALLRALDLDRPGASEAMLNVLGRRVRPDLRHCQAPRPFTLPFLAEAYDLLTEAANTGRVPDGLRQLDDQVRRALALGEPWAKAAAASHRPPAAGQYSFVDHLPDSRLESPVQDAQAAVWNTQLDGIVVPAIMLHPPACLHFRVPDGRRARLDFAVTIHPKAWDQPNAGGCQFIVTVNGQVSVSVSVDPAHVLSDRRWHECALDIPESASGAHEVVFETRALGGAQDFRWAVWREPRLTWETPAAETGNRPSAAQALFGAGADRRAESSAPAAVSVRRCNPSLEDLQKFYADAAAEFGAVEPPQLTEWHLKHSRVLPSREHILPLMPKGGVCAEVGTQTGAFAKQILAVLQPARLHLFDLDFSLFDQAGFQPAIEQQRVELHLGDSSTLLAAMPDHSFDFIYVDGDHSYEGVVRDLEQAARKIKDEGWIVCNDYTLYSPLEKAKYGVSRAVNEFCWNHGFEILYLGLHPWAYHDVALKRMKPEDFAQTSTLRPPPRTQPAPSAADALFGPGAERRAEPAAPAAAPRAASPPPAPSPAGAGTVDPACVIQEIDPGDEMFTGNKTHYLGVGQSALRCIETALFAAAKPKTGIRSILDLPCGHGRVMRFFRAAFPQASITACDLNRGAVDFCAKTFGAQPVYSEVDVDRIPLREKYDLIWSGSLLTHLRAGACADFVALFHSLVNPGGLIVFTLHGRWVERSLATGRYKYGLKDGDIATLLQEYYQSGFGYADYPGASNYGISVSAPMYVLAQLVSAPDLKLITYHEKGWDNHQDVVCVQKQSPNELLG